jgi:Flp pilus assembly protein TadD
MGWLWFIGMLVPVSGLVQIGAQAWAERFSYLPSIGLGIAAAWSVSPAAPRVRAAERVLAVIALAAAAVLSFRQASTWKDSTTLWTHAREVDPENYLALSKLGTLAIGGGRPDDAIPLLESALRANPAHASSRVTLAAALEQVGRAEEARAQLQQALELEPTLAIAHFNLANLLLDQSHAAEAEAHYRAALRGGLELPAVHQGLALALGAQGKVDDVP